MSCLFCGIVAGTVPSTVVLQTDRVLAFRDIAPAAPTHVLVVPKEHHEDLAAAVAADPALVADVFAAAVEVARLEGLEQGYRVVANTGEHSGRTVFHLHVHVLGGRPLGLVAG